MIHLANGMIPKMLEKCCEQVNITNGFNVDNVIFKKKSIILANQSVLAVFSAKYFVQNLKNMTLIYIDGKDIKVSI